MEQFFKIVTIIKIKNHLLLLVAAALFSGSNFLAAQNDSAVQPLPEPSISGSWSDAVGSPLMMIEDFGKLGEKTSQEKTERSREAATSDERAERQSTTGEEADSSLAETISTNKRQLYAM